MIDLKHLSRLNIQNPPYRQMFVANVLLRTDYNFPKKVDIVIEGVENIPRDRPAIIAMNHTDFYNYWPFMYQLYRDEDALYFAPLVKGKYYENRLLAFFFDMVNCIPLPSRGYIISKDAVATLKRRPTRDEYRLLRDHVDGNLSAAEFEAQATPELRRLLTLPRADFDPNRSNYATHIQTRYQTLMRQVVSLGERALQNNVHLLIFPAGTRSKRLQPGHTGVAQIALKTGAPVVPVGCNGSDKAYRGPLPFTSGGKVVYRVGKPLTVAGALANFAINAPFEPFTTKAERVYDRQFRGLTAVVMNAINDLLDPEYQFGDENANKTGTGVSRFI